LIEQISTKKGHRGPNGPAEALRWGYVFSQQIYRKIAPPILETTLTEVLAPRQLNRAIEPQTIANVLTLAKFGISLSDVLPPGASRSPAEQQIDFLLSQRLVEIEPSPRGRDSKISSVLYTTEKGFRYLRAYNSLVEMTGGLAF
jgi:hypothetical protein